MTFKYDRRIYLLHQQHIRLVRNFLGKRLSQTISMKERTKPSMYGHNGERICTGMHKFGSLIGDNCRIGANAVLSPGTLLKPGTIVKRLELIEQDPL